jgi:hypothetical protein
MPLLTLHPAPEDAPEGVAGVVSPLEGGEAEAWWAHERLVSRDGRGIDAIERLLARPDTPRTLIAWSGGLGDAPFDRSPMTWMTPGRTALVQACERLAPVLDRADRRLLLRTHCRHVLSDGPACAGFIRERTTDRIGVAFDPASMLEASMLAGGAEHLERLASFAGRVAAAVMIANVRRPEGADPEALPAPARTGEGALDDGLLGVVARAGADAGAMLILAGPDPDRQADALGLRAGG